VIRIVVAVLLAIALIVLAVPAIERGASLNTQRQVETSITAIDDAATSLVETEEISPDDHPNPKRVVDVRLPRGSLTTEAVTHFEITMAETGRYSSVRYVLADGTTRTGVIDEPVVWNDPHGNESVELDGAGEVQLVLSLRADENRTPIVVATRARV
jgi:hypothetical protein